MGTEIISLIILLACIILFVTHVIPNAVTACLGCLAFALTGICTLSEAFSGFSNSTVLLMFGMMVVGIAMEDTGAAKLIGKWVQKASASKEGLFILIAGTVSAILSTFLSNTAVIAIFLPIIASLSASSNMNRKNITLPVTMGAMFGGVCTLVGSTPQLTANGIISEMAGIELKMFDYMPVGLILFAVYILYSTTIGRKIGASAWGKETATEVAGNEAQQVQEIVVNKRKIITIVIILILVIVSFIGDWIPAAATAIIAAILCVITGCTTQKSVIKNMDWSVVFILAGCLGIATGISKGGAGDLMSDLLSAVVGQNTPPIILFIIFVVCTMLISNFITNSTAVVITLPIAVALCNARHLNILPFALGIVYAANLTYSTPLANAQTAMTLVAGYKFSDYIKYTWLLNILVLLTIIIFVPWFMPLSA